MSGAVADPARHHLAAQAVLMAALMHGAAKHTCFFISLQDVQWSFIAIAKQQNAVGQLLRNRTGDLAGLLHVLPEPDFRMITGGTDGKVFIQASAWRYLNSEPEQAAAPALNSNASRTVQALLAEPTAPISQVISLIVVVA